MISAFPLLDEARIVLEPMAPDMPPDFWWVTAGVLFVLALTAAIDAFTAIVPDVLIFLGLLALVGAQGVYASWEIAAHHLWLAIMAGGLIWIINLAWYRKFCYDALGMGDAKWTVLAVACFGVMPIVFAWGAGAVLATIFIGGAWLVRRPIARVAFAPFLLMGLGVGLFCLRFR